MSSTAQPYRIRAVLSQVGQNYNALKPTNQKPVGNNIMARASPLMPDYLVSGTTGVSYLYGGLQPAPSRPTPPITMPTPPAPIITR